MFTVAGGIAGVDYTLEVNGADPVAGCVSGTGEAVTALVIADGEPFTLAPTGGDVVLDIADPWLVHEWLLANTDVTASDGDLPAPPEEWAVDEDTIL